MSLSEKAAGHNRPSPVHTVGCVSVDYSWKVAAEVVTMPQPCVVTHLASGCPPAIHEGSDHLSISTGHTTALSAVLGGGQGTQKELTNCL